jgi:hypothetical protein
MENRSIVFKVPLELLSGEGPPLWMCGSSFLPAFDGWGSDLDLSPLSELAER